MKHIILFYFVNAKEILDFNIILCRAVHIHGTNGARFKTLGNRSNIVPYSAKKNFFQHPTYEEWYNPKYSNTRHRTIQTVSGATTSSNHHHHDHKAKANGFHALNLGGGK